MSGSTPTIAICAGEASGDLNGAELVRRLHELRPDIRVWAAGGNRLREAGVEIVIDMTGSGAIGVVQSLKGLPAIATKYFRFRRELLKRRPDVFVPIDFGAFNIRLAQVAHKYGIRVVYYFPPSSWRRKPRSAAKLLACGGRVITPFPWSAEFLKSQGVDARFVGHPLIDVVKPTTDKFSFLREYALSESLPTIALFPGSRKHELQAHLPPLIGCAKELTRKLGAVQFIIGAAVGNAAVINRTIQSLRASDSLAIRVVQNRNYDCIAHSDLLITASGTATLEAAILGTPMVIIYSGSALMRLEYRLRRRVVEKFIGMPNIIADKVVCPELIEEDVSPETIASTVLSILEKPEALHQMKSELAAVNRILGEPGASRRAALALLELGELS